MFLLIPNAARYASQMGFAFTFQYVSINTIFLYCQDIFKLPLHSNMFLLILQQATALQAANIPLHSNMFLLIREMRSGITNSLQSLYIPICFY